MLFSSIEFIFIFAPLVFFIYFFLNKYKYIKIGSVFLLLSSIFFYGYWKPAYLPIIMVSILFNYFCGEALSRKLIFSTNQYFQKIILILGVSANLLTLGYFKYSNFLIDNINSLLNEDFNNLKILLPLGISFFTFQQIAYLVDSYRGETHEYNFVKYATFVTFFPQLIAGPIVHHKEMMDQFEITENLKLKYENICTGLVIFAVGLAKKVLIADTFSVWADAGFGAAQSLDIIESWIASLSYTFQLYFDFSGYSDMAIGLGLLFNIILPQNFDSPYKSTNIQEFWRKWHMTLSRFLKDYIYIPFGGNRLGETRTCINLLITFLLGGIWHGAGWTFIIWGCLHGTAQIICRLWGKLGFKLYAWFAWLITFNFINASWVFFRATKLDDAYKMLMSMFGLKENPFALSDNSLITLSRLFNYPVYNLHPSTESNLVFLPVESAVYILIAVVIVIFAKNTSSLLETKMHPFLIMFSSFLFSLSIIRLNSTSTDVFLYFNF